MKMKKLFSGKKIYNTLQKNRKWLKRRSLILALFIFGVNIFAWFVYISRANVDINANVLSWDVDFFNDGVAVNTVVIDTPKLYPGMDTYSKDIIITNSSDLKAKFEYSIDEILMYDENVLPYGYTLEQAKEYLGMIYPFSIVFSESKSSLDVNDSLTFNIKIDWPFEDNEKYFKVTDQYTYDPSINYYIFSGGNYIQTDVSESEFDSIKNNLYLEKDDVDSFFGTVCGDCFKLKLTLVVNQSNE